MSSLKVQLNRKVSEVKKSEEELKKRQDEHDLIIRKVEDECSQLTKALESAKERVHIQFTFYAQDYIFSNLKCYTVKIPYYFNKSLLHFEMKMLWLSVLGTIKIIRNTLRGEGSVNFFKLCFWMVCKIA